MLLLPIVYEKHQKDIQNTADTWLEITPKTVSEPKRRCEIEIIIRFKKKFWHCSINAKNIF